MSNWLTDPELFLYAKGIGSYGVHLWRCKKPVSSSSSSSLVVPMKPDDFNFVSNVKNHMELIGDIFEWDELDYKRLVNYIYEKHLLVNSQGFVIAELQHKANKDVNKTIDDANEDVPAAIYIRSLDVLPLKSYIPELKERPIPLRTVKYLGDANGRVALIEEDSKVTKLTARVDNIEAENTRLESKNNTLDTNVKKLTAGLATTTDNVVVLESKNKTLEGKVTRLTTDLATKTDKVATLESKNITLEGKVTKLTADLATRTNELATSQQELNRVIKAYKEVWMNDFTKSEWVGSEGVRKLNPVDQNLIFVGQQGTYTIDRNDTNVQARYMYKVKRFAVGCDYKAVSLEDLIPNKEKARFSEFWHYCRSQGKIYVILYPLSGQDDRAN